MRARMLFLFCWLAMCTQADAADKARDYLEFAASNAAACVMFQGKMRQLVNKHLERAIEVYIYRYMGDIQQPGRGVETVPPGGKPVDLGCTRIAGGSAQDWEIGKAQFVR
ncbi:MAG: hypothetical protein M3329_09055 [Pseudomonadota bacterium]|jgi:hypothetical protein|nr:hypothetical protein [Pseudomonadota bacterium]